MNLSDVAPIDRGQLIRKSDLKYAFAAVDSFTAEVEHGEIFEIETELNIGGHLIHSLDEKLRDTAICEPSHRSDQG